MNATSMIIVGAGAAGLAAARVLAATGCKVVILEGRERIGGRIFTVRGLSLDMPIELGAEFIHGTPEATLELVREGGLVRYDVTFKHLQKSGRGWADPEKYANDLKKAMDRLDRAGKRDMSFAAYLAKYRSGRSLARSRRAAIDFVEGFDAADTERVSAQSLAQEQQGVGDLEDEPQFRLLAGYGGLIDFMREELDRQGVPILLKKVVQEIHWQPRNVELVCRDNRQHYQAQRLLVTLPVGVLQLAPQAPGAVRFFPDLPEKRREANRLGSGAVIKVILRFHEAFWEQPRAGKGASSKRDLTDATFLHDPSAPFPTWWTALPLRVPVLTGWLGGPRAWQMSSRPSETIKTLAMKSLSGLFGISTARLGGMLAGFYCHDWPADPLARAAYSYTMVGGQSAHQKLAQPVEDTLFFAGEATDTSGEASTVAGAIASGQRAAREMLASL